VASDPDGDPLTYSLATAPASMKIDPASGVLTWSPTISDIGTASIDVHVSDGRGGSADQPYSLTVAADTEAPMVTVILSENPANVGDMMTITVSAADNVAVASMGLKVAGQPVVLDAQGSATIQVSAIERLVIIGSATDTAGNVGTQENDLVVRDPSDHTPPTVAITSPADSSQITAPVQVIGTADDANLVGYTLEVGRAVGGTWQTVFTGNKDVVNGVLGTFDPSLLPNDSYILRLTATDSNGNSSSAETSVDVIGNLKLGNFRLSFTDLSIPVSGIPITVTRTYDTMNIGSDNAFGPGWSLDFRNTDLRSNVDWTGMENFGVYNAFYEGAHVYVTLPGGSREEFTFHPWLQTVYFIQIWHPAFTPDPGVTDTLSVPDVQLTQIDYGQRIEY
jgi:hypothetical protein